MDEFWSNCEDIAAIPASSVLQIGQLIDLYLDVVSENWDFLSEEDSLVAARLLLNSHGLKSNPKFTRQRLLACISQARDKPLHWASFLAICLGVEDDVLNMLKESHIKSIVDLLWMYRHTEDKKCLTLYMQLLFIVHMRNDHDLTDLYFPEFCKMLLSAVCEEDLEQEIGLAALKLTVALNHKLTLQSLPDLVMIVLGENLAQFRRFGACLIWYFNRSKTSSNRLLIAKLLALIMRSPETSDLLYFNDLKVLLDILLRELMDINRDHERLRELYLLVLLGVLQKDSLHQEPYKRSTLVSVLRTSLEFTSNPNIVNLINDCLSVPWLGWSNSVHVSPHESRDDLVLLTKVESIGGEPESPFEDVFSPPRTPNILHPDSDSTPVGSPLKTPVGSPMGHFSLNQSPPPHHIGFIPHAPSSSTPPEHPRSAGSLEASPFEDTLRPHVPPRPSSSPLPPPSRGTSPMPRVNSPLPPPSRKVRARPPPPPPRGRD